MVSWPLSLRRLVPCLVALWRAPVLSGVGIWQFDFFVLFLAAAPLCRAWSHDIYRPPIPVCVLTPSGALYADCAPSMPTKLRPVARQGTLCNSWMSQRRRREHRPTHNIIAYPAEHTLLTCNGESQCCRSAHAPIDCAFCWKAAPAGGSRQPGQ